MKLFIDKSKCTVTESVNGQILEIETDNEVYIEDEYQNALLFPYDCGKDVNTFASADSMKKPKNFNQFSPFITPVPKDYHL